MPVATVRPAARPVQAAKPVQQKPVTSQGDAQELLKRVQASRQRCEDFSRERSRITGELDAAKRQYEETEKKCKETFDCTPAELPAIREQMTEEGRRLVEEAEAILSGTVAPAAENEEIPEET